MGNVVSGTYVGKVDNEIFTEIWYKSVTLDLRLATIRDNVKGSIQLPLQVTTDPGIRSLLCEPTMNGASETSSKTLTVCNFGIDDKICKDTLTPVFDDAGIFGADAGVSNYPQEFLDVIVTDRMNSIEAVMDDIIWRSDSTVVHPGEPWLDFCDGFLKQIKDDPTTIVAATVGASLVLTTANIKAELDKVYKAIPSVLIQANARNNSQLGLYLTVTPSVYQLLAIALTNQAYANDYALTKVTLTTLSGGTYDTFAYMGMPVIPNQGLFQEAPAKDNLMIVSYATNLVIGTDAISDLMGLEVTDMQPLTKDRLIRIQGQFRLGTQTRIGKYVVTYGLVP